MRMRFFYLFLALFVSFTAHAEVQTSQVGICSTPSAKFGLYLEAGKTLQEGTQLSVVSSEVSPTTDLNLTLTGIYRAQAKKIDLPHWNPQQITFDQCSFRSSTAQFFSDGYTNTLMYLQFYFIGGNPSPDVDIDELVKTKQAIPLKAHILCRHLTTETTLAVLTCDQIKFLDKIIPVDTTPQIFSNAPSVVSLDSSICGESSSVKGAGTLINWEGKQLVLTSANSIKSNGGKNSCTVSSIGTTKVPLKLLRHDYASGLALLEPAVALGSGLNLSNEILDAYPDEAVLGGQTVELLATRSTRHFIPRISRVIEVLSAIPVTNSSVGEPLKSAAGEVLGVISHQHLKIFPGSLTRPIVWADQQSSNTLVAISAIEIRQWLKNQSGASFQIEPKDQSLISFQSGHLTFTQDCPVFDSSAEEDQYPIGGGDAVGIGGDPSGYRACKILIAKSETGDAKFYNPSLQSWHDGLVKRLKSNDRAEVLFLFTRAPNGILKREYFYSAESFFQVLSKDLTHQHLALLIRPAGSTTAGTDPSLVTLRSAAMAEAELVRSTYVNQQFNDFDAADLLRRIYLVSSIIQSEEYRTLKASDFDELLDTTGRYKRAWQLLEFIVLKGKKIRTDLQILKDEWTKIK